METFFWWIMMVALKVAYTLFTVGAVVFLWQNVTVHGFGVGVAFGSIHAMLALFLALVWRFEG